nr:hypothetical protein [Tanacetum cinerariifolium]
MNNDEEETASLRGFISNKLSSFLIVMLFVALFCQFVFSNQSTSTPCADESFRLFDETSSPASMEEVQTSRVVNQSETDYRTFTTHGVMGLLMYMQVSIFRVLQKDTTEREAKDGSDLMKTRKTMT